MIRVNIVLMGIYEVVIAVVVWGFGSEGFWSNECRVFINMCDGGDGRECSYEVLGLFLYLVIFVVRSDNCCMVVAGCLWWKVAQEGGDGMNQSGSHEDMLHLFVRVCYDHQQANLCNGKLLKSKRRGFPPGSFHFSWNLHIEFAFIVSQKVAKSLLNYWRTKLRR